MPSECDRLQRLLGLIDLTSLNEDDSPERIEVLCRMAAGPFGPPAALCIYPEYVLLARRTLDALGLEAVAVVSVANFPDGGADVDRVTRACRRLRAAGADEVDVVLPYRSLKAGDLQTYRRVAHAAREVTGDGVLKCILETGLLDDGEIDQAIAIALDAGADFIKTSTGKAAAHASPEAAERMLRAVRDCGRPAGVKVAGGIRTVEQALGYLAQAERVLGAAQVDARRFRIGASALFDAVLAELGGVRSADAAREGY